jgi:FixJ family two-component response regulator
MTRFRHESSRGGDERQPVVRVVDDDPTLLRAVATLLRAAGFTVTTFDTPGAFLADRGGGPGCAVLDLHMPGAGGLELQEALALDDEPIPVIFLTGQGTVRSSVRAMKNGAVDFLTKPVAADELVDAVRRAIAIDAAARTERRGLRALRAAYERLTPREREVFALVALGRRNKQIAAVLGTSERTVKAHRANVMQKMGMASTADVARAAARLRDATPGPLPDRGGAAPL